MRKEELLALAQLLTAMKDAVEKLEEGEKEKDIGKMASARREILNFQKEMGKLL